MERTNRMGATGEVTGFAEEHSDASNRDFAIHNDHRQFKVTAPTLTGEQFRSLASSAIGDDRDLWLEVPGELDEHVETTQEVSLRNGMHFFTAPHANHSGGASR